MRNLPPGWECSREAGHDGPCAASMVSPEQTNRQSTPLSRTSSCDIVADAEYRPGWRFVLQHEDRGQGQRGPDALDLLARLRHLSPDRGETYRVVHYFRCRRRRLIVAHGNGVDCLVEVETHECCEFLQVGGQRPFAPNHGPGRNPYSVVEAAGSRTPRDASPASISRGHRELGTTRRPDGRAARGSRSQPRQRPARRSP